MKRTFLLLHWVLGLTLIGAGIASANTTNYSTDFSTNPGWVTDQPTNYYWDETTETYFLHGENYDPGYSPSRYTYHLLPEGVDSFILQWDMKPTRTDWSAGNFVGIYDSGLNTAGTNSIWGTQAIQAGYGRSDGGYGWMVYFRGSDGTFGEALFLPPGLNEWYTCKLTYDAESSEVRFEVWKRATSVLIWDHLMSVSGDFTNELKYLGASRGDIAWDAPGLSHTAVAESFIDNVQLSSSSSDDITEVAIQCALSSEDECLANMALCFATIMSGGYAYPAVQAALIVESICDISVLYQEGKDAEAGLMSVVLFAKEFLELADMIPCLGGVVSCVEAKIYELKDVIENCNGVYDVECMIEFLLSLTGVDPALSLIIGSPVQVSVEDASGNILYVDTNGVVHNGIPGSWIFSMGENKKYALILDPTDFYRVIVTGTDEAGSGAQFDFGVHYPRPNGSNIGLVYRNVETRANAQAEIVLKEEVHDYSLLLDLDADGTVDQIVQPEVITDLTTDDILNFFDESIENGTLEGNGSGNSANGRLNALRNMLEMAGELLKVGDIEGVCGQLNAALKKCDGDSPPPDFVTGDAVTDLYDMITKLMIELGCE